MLIFYIIPSCGVGRQKCENVFHGHEHCFHTSFFALLLLHSGEELLRYYTLQYDFGYLYISDYLIQ